MSMLAHQFQTACLFRLLDQHVEDRAFGVDGPPKGETIRLLVFR